MSRAQQLWQLTRPDLASIFPPLRSMGAAAVGLPVYLTSFVGRDADVSTLLELFAASRVVTLTGPPGVGKTRLATEVAVRAGELCADGVWFVELAALTQPTGLDDMVATTLGLAAAPVSRRTVILDAIGQRRIMLVLDNAEHLLGPVADLVGALMRRCRALRVLVTSRQVLAIDGEQVWPVSALSAAAAVELFAERARRAHPQADLHEGLMRQVCTRLDGIPMAIELVAARVRSLSLGEIADRIDERFDALTSGRRGTLERNKTIRAAIDWSYRLLDEDEKKLFGRVSVFAGGFDVAAAESVTGFAPLEQSQVVDLLDELVLKSMLTADVHLATTRYRLLESLREFAAEHLGADADVVSRRHAAYYRAFAESRGGFAPAESATALEAIIDELDNLRAAFTFALTHDDADTALRLTTSLHVLWHLYDFPEVGLWVAAAAEMQGAGDHPLGPTAHGQAAMAATYRLDIPVRERHLEQGMATFWGPYARSYLNRSLDQQVMSEGHDDIRRAVALATTEHPLARAILDSYNVLFALWLGRTEHDSWERLCAYADQAPNHGLLLLRRAQAHRALHSHDRTAALAAYDDVRAISSGAPRRSMLWGWATVPRLLLLFDLDRAAALADGRAYLIEARNVGSRRFVQPALGRIAVMLAGIGREETAAALQSFTREPAGGAAMSDGDPAAELTFDTLTPEQVAEALARGARRSYDKAIQLALDELRDAIEAIEA